METENTYYSFIILEKSQTIDYSKSDITLLPDGTSLLKPINFKRLLPQGWASHDFSVRWEVRSESVMDQTPHPMLLRISSEIGIKNILFNIIFSPRQVFERKAARRADRRPYWNAKSLTASSRNYRPPAPLVESVHSDAALTCKSRVGVRSIGCRAPDRTIAPARLSPCSRGAPTSPAILPGSCPTHGLTPATMTRIRG
jgi:hypothetical protein